METPDTGKEQGAQDALGSGVLLGAKLGSRAIEGLRTCRAVAAVAFAVVHCVADTGPDGGSWQSG